MSKAKLNQPKLNKIIKKEKELWVTRRGDDLYIISPHYIIRTQEEIKGGLLTTLTKTFGKLPDDGEVLKIGIRELDTDKALKTVYEGTKNNKNGTKLVDTGLLDERIGFTLKILANIKNGNYINVDNEKIFIDGAGSFQGKESLKPVYIEGKKSDMILFPVRCCDDNDFLKML